MILFVAVMMMMTILVGGSELRLLFFVILGVIIKVKAPNFSTILSTVLLALAVDAPVPLLIGVSGDELGFFVLKTTMNCK
jgi:hypothetical protein